MQPFVTGEAEDGFCRTRTGDGGEADFYVGDGHFMVNHFSVGETIELIFRTASSLGLVLYGPELPVMLTDPQQLETLPAELRPSELEPVLVTHGGEVAGLIAGDRDVYRRCRQRLESATDA